MDEDIDDAIEEVMARTRGAYGSHSEGAFTTILATGVHVGVGNF